MNVDERDIAEIKDRIRDAIARKGCRSAHSLFTTDEILIDFFISKTVTFALNSDGAVDRWIKKRLRAAALQSEMIPVHCIDKWRIDRATGNIGHVSGRFFSILGLTVRHRSMQRELVWDQPIIDQPEIGILGILARKFQGVLHFCLQAKEEPGNIHSVQLSPTVQATHSNYTQAHGGGLPPFLDYFLDAHARQVIFAKLQSEDGGRFLFKSNRNMIVLVEEEIPVLPDGFIWLTLRQISELLKRDNLINACARSVLASVI
jgi:oxidase EvaA